MAGNRVNVSVFADTKQFQRSMKKLGDVSGISKLGNGLKSLVGHLKDMAKYAGAGLVALGTYATKAASDLEQSQGTVDDVFKGSADQVKKYAASASKDLGLSKNQYFELSNVMATQLKNGGTALDELAGKSNELISLGADLSAGFGGDTTEAVQAISSALKGERDPIERYGVSLKQAALDAKAAEMGFTKVGGSFDNEAQQAATLALIMEQTGDMHGKFGREAGTVAHKAQVLKAQLTDMAAKLGGYLIPIVSAVVGWISDNLGPAFERLTGWIESDAVPAVKDLAERFKTDWLPRIKEIGASLASNLLPKLQSFATFVTGSIIPGTINLAKWLAKNKGVILPLAAAITTLVGAYKTYKTVTTTITAVTTTFKTAQALLNTTMKKNPVLMVVSIVLALVAALITAYQTSETFRNFVDGAFNAVKNVVMAVVNWFTQTAGPAIAGFFTGAVDKARAFKDGAIEKFQSFISWVTSLPSKLFAILGQLGQLPGKAATWVGGFKDRAIAKFKEAISWITGVPGRVFSGIGGLSGLGTRAREYVQKFKDGAVEKFNSTVNWVKNLPSRIISALGSVGSLLREAGKSIINGLWNGMKSAWSNVTNWVGGLGSWIANHKGPEAYDRQLLIPAGKWIMGGLHKGLLAGFADVRKTVNSMGNQITTSFTAGTEPLGAPSLLVPYPTGNATNARTYNVTVNCLNPTVETGRIIAKSLEEYEEVSGR